MATLRPKGRAHLSEETSPVKRKARAASLPRSTGPRTLEGKARSRYNALKHGIFAKSLPVLGDSGANLSRLLNAFVDDLCPQGAEEVLLVEELATLYYRKGRLLQAKQAQIILQQDQVWSEEWGTPVSSVDQILPISGGLLSRLDDPVTVSVLGFIYKTIYEFRKDVEARGVAAIDNSALDIICGRHPGRDRSKKLCRVVLNVMNLAGQRSPKDPSKPLADPAHLKAALLEVLDEELKQISERWELAIDAFFERVALRRQSLLVLPPDILDRYTRYEKHLDGMIERTRNRLERLQRRRLGDRVLPPLSVELSRA